MGFLKRMKFKIRADIRKPFIRHRNRKLCEEFPFLIPWNRWSGKLITDCANGEKGYWPKDQDAIPKYKYDYTELDDMPTGWRKAFGIQMCRDLKDALKRENDLNRWRIVELKEKFGALRIYDNGTKISSKVPLLERMYEERSVRTCIICGMPATMVTTGWISPYCDKCCQKERAVPIDEYYDTGVYE